MNTNLGKTIGQFSVALFTMLAFAALMPRALAQGGIPLWTNLYNNGTGGVDQPLAIAVDSGGNVFVTGHSSLGFGYPDYATIKYSSAGVPLWTNRYNGPGNNIDSANGVAVDRNGDVFVTGQSFGGDTGYDYATIKYSSAGVPLWTNRYNGPNYRNDFANAEAVDSSGNVIVTGKSFGSGSDYDYATIKYSGAGVPLWTNCYNGPGNSIDAANAVAVDASGNVFVTGSSDSSGYGTNSDYATVAYSSAGAPLWTNRYDGPGHGDDLATGIAVDGNGNVIVAGRSAATNGYYDYATIKYSNAGLALWTNRYAGSAFYFNVALAVDSKGNVFLTGTPATVAYSPAGMLLWTNYGGISPGGSSSFGMAVDNSGNVFVAAPTVAYSGAGVPVWTNFSAGAAIAVDANGNVFVTGIYGGHYMTIKYSPTVVPIHLAIERDGSGGFFLRYTGAPDVTYRLQRAASVTGTWTNLSTNTAPASGLIEYRETAPLPGQAFYRTAQP